MKPTFVYLMRTCTGDLKSHGGFQWPKKGKVEAPDWKPTKECGNGLHGWLWGEGDGNLGEWGDGCRVLVVKALAKEVIDLNGKAKFRRGTVVYCGDAAGAVSHLHKRLPKAKMGKWVCIAGTASAGDRGTASAGYRGTASAGYRGTASAGDLGTASAGYRGTASAGDDGVLVIRYHDGNRWRLVVGYVGENGIKAGVRYHLANGKMVEGEDADTKQYREEAAKISAMKPADR